MLTGRTALVTGGSQGIGRGIADVLRKHGAKVAVIGLTGDELTEVREAGFPAYVLDVRDREQTNEVVGKVAEELGGLSILAANAGVYPQVSIDEMTDEHFDDIFNINVNAVLPGNVITPGLEALGQAYIDEVASQVPRGKLGVPEDIGEAVAYLASDGAGFVNGHGIVVDGGQILPEDSGALE